MLKIKVFMSKKKEDVKVIALVYDLGYTVKFLTFNQSDIAEICDISVRSLNDLGLGEYELDYFNKGV